MSFRTSFPSIVDFLAVITVIILYFSFLNIYGAIQYGYLLTIGFAVGIILLALNQLFKGNFLAGIEGMVSLVLFFVALLALFFYPFIKVVYLRLSK